MAIVTPGTLSPDVVAASDRARAIHESTLRQMLEPERNGETVAIHVDSGAYAIGQNSPAALRALRQHHPSGFVVTMRVGPDKEDPTLDRILGRQLRARRQP